MQGELLSPFLLQDLDGDGQQDAAVLYTTAQSSNVCIAFLQKNAAGVWQVSQSIEGLADTVDNVRLAQLQDGAATQLVVGYLAAQGDSYLAVYSYENGTVNAILEQSYEQYLVEDITGGGNNDPIQTTAFGALWAARSALRALSMAASAWAMHLHLTTWSRICLTTRKSIKRPLTAKKFGRPLMK